MKPTIEIEYCPKCGWLLRATYMAQELLTTFQEEVYGVTLIPSEVAGRFQIRTSDQIIFDRKREDGFKDIKIIKQLVRNQICPDKSLGHSDRKA
ncbi:SelT/SelW/SelH family protein [Sphingobacterium litopenaei]|uniref:SelT/SelW/SelH family protein n=1 Tax=Sphingobacterium litopenaei TaxID=2763500 RepID=A0ABR7YDT9_9SPHI|nr:SelT/SelW/SelH family protein [Sphingobacterium litopenaei]MBD1429483.1 SelT/SelW/SelH family protein [Sphingobacterium litopenaei]